MRVNRSLSEDANEECICRFFSRLLCRKTCPVVAAGSVGSHCMTKVGFRFLQPGQRFRSHPSHQTPISTRTCQVVQRLRAKGVVGDRWLSRRICAAEVTTARKIRARFWFQRSQASPIPAFIIARVQCVFVWTKICRNRYAKNKRRCYLKADLSVYG
jgi:hypothetical protein